MLFNIQRQAPIIQTKPSGHKNLTSGVDPKYISTMYIVHTVNSTQCTQRLFAELHKYVAEVLM